MEATTAHYEKRISILGKKYIQSDVYSPFDFITIAAKGINANVIINFRDYFAISRGFAAYLLNVSEPTIYRWLRTSKKLERNVSVQLFELTDLFLYGSEVFENKENFFKWIDLPNAAFGGLQPKELLDIPGGIAKVYDLLGRIEHGVYS